MAERRFRARLAWRHRHGRENQKIYRLHLGKTWVMKADPRAESKIQQKRRGLKSKIASYASLVRFSHTIFAMPFAMASLALAWPRHPVTLRSLLWILIAMVSARSAAMAFNRLVDRKFDAVNP